MNDHCVIASPKVLKRGLGVSFLKKMQIIVTGKFLEEYWETLRQSIFGALLN